MGIVWSKQRTYQTAGVLAVVLLVVSMFFALQKPVSLEVDGKVLNQRLFFTNTVGEVLTRNNVTLGDKDVVQPGVDTRISRNMTITVTRCFPVTVIADGQTKQIYTTPVPIKEAIVAAGFELGASDLVKTVPGELTVPDQNIEIIRVSQKSFEEQQPLPYTEEQTLDNSLERGLSKTIRNGQNGMAVNTVAITYHNNVEVKREIVASKPVKEPVNKVIAMGTITSVSRGGQRLDFKEAKIMTVSAYTYTGHNTATGKAPEVGMVAVDPGVIPLGTRMYIEGYGYAVASDTGGAIKGDRLDVFLESENQCVNWGMRTNKVYILR
jgi:Uncharacterized protein conserved in bacteria